MQTRLCSPEEPHINRQTSSPNPPTLYIVSRCAPLAYQSTVTGPVRDGRNQVFGAANGWPGGLKAGWGRGSADGRSSEQTNSRTKRRIDGRASGPTSSRTERRMDGRASGQASSRTGRRKDRGASGQASSRTEDGRTTGQASSRSGGRTDDWAGEQTLCRAGGRAGDRMGIGRTDGEAGNGRESERAG